MKKKIQLGAFVLAQLALVLCLLVPLLRFAPEEVPLAFVHWEAQGRYDEGWGFSAEGEATDAFLQSPPLALPRGAYTLHVAYEAEDDFALRLTDADNYGLLTPEGPVQLSRSARNAQVALECSADVPVCRIALSYSGRGALLIEDMRLTTSPAALRRRLVALCAFLLALDGFLVLKKRRDPRPPLFALGIALLCSLPLFMGKLPDGHDGIFHLMRIEALADGLARGVFPLRLSAIHLDGWGYPTSLYYGDLLLTPAALLRLCGFSVTGAVKAYCFLLNLATAAVSLSCFSRIAGDTRRGALLALAYCASGYRLMDLYVRMALGEYTAMLFLPMIAAGLFDLCREGKSPLGDALLLGMGFAGLAITHLLTAEMALFSAGLCVLPALSRVLRPRRLGAILLGAGLALLLSAFFVWPMLDSLSLPVSITSVPSPNARRIQVEGAHLAQLFSPFASPIGGEATNAPSGRFALTPGLALIGAFLLALWRWATTGKASPLLPLSALFLFLSTDLFPWDRLDDTAFSFLNALQFPWRWLTIACLLLTLLLGELLRPSRGAERAVLLACVLPALLFAGQFTREATFMYPTDRGEICLHEDEIGGGEYLRYDPRTQQVVDDAREALTSDILQENLEWLDLLSREGLDFHLDAIVSPEQEGAIELPIFRYKGVVARDAQGRLLPVSDGERCRVRVSLPRGFDGQLTVRFEEPLSWRIAGLISLTALAGVCVLTWRLRRKGRSPCARG